MGQEYRYPDRENPPPVVDREKVTLTGNLQAILVFIITVGVCIASYIAQNPR